MTWNSIQCSFRVVVFFFFRYISFKAFFLKVRRQPKSSHIQILSGKDVWVLKSFLRCIFLNVFYHLKHVSMESQTSSLPTNHPFLSPEVSYSEFHQRWFLMDTPLAMGYRFSIKCHCVPSSSERPGSAGSVEWHGQGCPPLSFVYLVTSHRS